MCYTWLNMLRRLNNICDQSHPYGCAWNNQNVWVYHNLSDITKTHINYFYTFPCNSRNFYFIGTINEPKVKFSSYFSELNITCAKCAHKSDFPKFGHIFLSSSELKFRHWYVWPMDDIRNGFMIDKIAVLLWSWWRLWWWIV